MMLVSAIIVLWIAICEGGRSNIQFHAERTGGGKMKWYHTAFAYCVFAGLYLSIPIILLAGLFKSDK